MLKQVDAVVGQVFAETERFFSEETPFPVFANPAARMAFKDEHFSSTDEDIVHYWQPWLMKIDQFVDDTDFPASSARSNQPEV